MKVTNAIARQCQNYASDTEQRNMNGYAVKSEKCFRRVFGRVKQSRKYGQHTTRKAVVYMQKHIQHPNRRNRSQDEQCGKQLFYERALGVKYACFEMLQCVDYENGERESDEYAHICVAVVNKVNKLAGGGKHKNAEKISQPVVRIPTALCYHKSENGERQPPDNSQNIRVRKKDNADVIYQHR